MYSIASMQDLHDIRQLEQSIRDDHRAFLSLKSLAIGLESIDNTTDSLSPIQAQQLQHAARNVGSQIQGLGLESVTDVSVEQLLTISTEGVKDTIAKIWEKTKELFAKIWKMLKDMMAKVQAWLAKNDLKNLSANLRKFAEENPDATVMIKLPEHIVASDVGDFRSFTKYEADYIRRMTERSYLVGELEGIAKRVTAPTFDLAHDVPFIHTHGENLTKRWHNTGARIGAYMTFRLVSKYDIQEDKVKPEKILSYLNNALSTSGEHFTGEKTDTKREIKVTIDALLHGLGDVEHLQDKVTKEAAWLNKKLDETGRSIEGALKNLGAGGDTNAAAKLETMMGLLALHRKIDGAMITDLGREGHVIRAISDVIRHSMAPGSKAADEE